MKIYRSIEFSKLIFLLSEERQFLWDSHQDQRDSDALSHRLHKNWWMNDTFSKDRREMVSAVINESQDSFFYKSMEFNAMSGGRFNPEKSFGVLYTADSPIIACLEVLYHKVIELHPIYNNLQSKRDQLQSGLGMDIPNELKVLIIAFEVEIDDSQGLVRVNDSDADLKQLCEKIGFGRYTVNNFDREFIFGNDYEISRHIGTHLHSSNNKGFFVPSARVSFDIQDELEMRNIILFEHTCSELNPVLTGRFVEYVCSVDLYTVDQHGMDVRIEAGGGRSQKAMFKLEQVPPKRGPHKQVKAYLPNTSKPQGRSRLVQIQKYKRLPTNSGNDE